MAPDSQAQLIDATLASPNPLSFTINRGETTHCQTSAAPYYVKTNSGAVRFCLKKIVSPGSFGERYEVQPGCADVPGATLDADGYPIPKSFVGVFSQFAIERFENATTLTPSDTATGSATVTVTLD